MKTATCKLCGKELEEYEQLDLTDGIFCGLTHALRWMKRKVIRDCFVCGESVYDTDGRTELEGTRGEDGKKALIHMTGKPDCCYKRFMEVSDEIHH